MRIAVMGAGSIGGYFGGMLARGGNDVTLIARGANLQAINARGLKIVKDDEEFTVNCHATVDPGGVRIEGPSLNLGDHYPTHTGSGHFCPPGQAKKGSC